MDKLKIGIDIDFTITYSEESMAFFALLTNSLRDKAEIYIITNRPTDDKSVQETVEELSQMGIYYDKLETTAKKDEYILENDIDIYFDDTDEYFLSLPQNVVVFKIREPGNFDFDQHKWIYGDKTGINIEQK